MATALHPCPTCTRHVRATETTCPLCGAALGAGFAAPRVGKVVPHRQFTRTMLAAGVASSLGTWNCGSSYGNGIFFGEDAGRQLATPLVVDAGDQPDGGRDARRDGAGTGDATGRDGTATDAGVGEAGEGEAGRSEAATTSDGGADGPADAIGDVRADAGVMPDAHGG